MAGALVRSVQPAAPARRRRLCAGRGGNAAGSGGFVIDGKDQDDLSGFTGTVNVLDLIDLLLEFGQACP